MKRTEFSYTFSFAVCLFLGVLTFGCSSKTPTYSPQKQGHKQENKKTYSKPTQRPYVINGIRYYPIPSAEGYSEQGKASWYGKKFHGRKTANGETYDMYAETAAHKTLPMGTMLLVTNLENNKQIVARVNDRGPFVKNRIIDLTYTGAESLGMIKNGTARVRIVALSDEQPQPAQPQHQDEQSKRELQPLVANKFDQGNFYVQVGAFIELENARKLAKKFALKGRNVTIQQYPAAGMQLYRVMVFAGTSLAKVKVYEKHLEQNGFPDALVLAR
ncbi:septal ring lytic transglycosylase RlpA family protein [Desulfogranum marinum]|uniref:septal ring lytic transglycosylase RlpA family protein n=1 Tax=Desulfogranum marinum TaxID=453220 RepID=UPI0029C71AF1|nr:septal ring lytic transglycosylase RlpA family protein [Desulfogranum marinum]